MNRLDAAREIARATSCSPGWEVHVFKRYGERWVTLTFTDPDGVQHRAEFTAPSRKVRSGKFEVYPRGGRRQCCARDGASTPYCIRDELHPGPHRDVTGHRWSA